MDLGPRGPKGPQGPPWGPTGPPGAPWGPLGPHGPLGAPWGPLGAHLGPTWAPWGSKGCPGRPTEPKTLIFIRCFNGCSQKHRFPIGFSKVWVFPGAPRAKNEKRLRTESGVRNSPPDPPDPPEMVSGAAVQTLPNHAQESQDDVSSQANSLKLAL